MRNPKFDYYENIDLKNKDNKRKNQNIETITKPYLRNESRVFNRISNARENLTNYLSETRSRNRFHSSGLRNQGNTCFLNSILQAFTNLDEFQIVIEKIYNKSSFLQSLRNLISSMKTKIDTDLMLTNFLTELRRVSNFGHGKQCDAKLFYIYLINRIVEESKNKKEEIIQSLVSKQVIFVKNENKKIENLMPIIECYAKKESEMQFELNEYFGMNDLNNESFEDIKTTYHPSNIIPVSFPNPISIEMFDKSYKILNHNYTLQVLIIRTGMNEKFGHAYAIAKEESGFVCYNDYSETVIGKSQKISNCIMAFFKKTNNYL